MIGRRFLALALASLLAACASPVTVKTDFDAKASFDGLRSYSWIAEPAGDPALVPQSVIQGIDTRLQARGWKRVAEGEVHVAAHVTTRDGQTFNNFYSGIGHDLTWLGFGPVPDSVTMSVDPYRAGTLVVDMFDAKSRRAERGRSQRRCAERERAERERAERERAERERAERDRAERDRTERDRTERDRGQRGCAQRGCAQRGRERRRRGGGGPGGRGCAAFPVANPAGAPHRAAPPAPATAARGRSVRRLGATTTPGTRQHPPALTPQRQPGSTMRYPTPRNVSMLRSPNGVSILRRR